MGDPGRMRTHGTRNLVGNDLLRAASTCPSSSTARSRARRSASTSCASPTTLECATAGSRRAPTRRSPMTRSSRAMRSPRITTSPSLATSLEALDPAKTRTIDIQDFVDIGDIDPDLLRHPVLPRPRRRRREGLFAPGQVDGDLGPRRDRTLCPAQPRAPCRNPRPRQRLDDDDDALRRRGRRSLKLDDVLPQEKPKVQKREQEMAEALIDSLSSDFDPSQYRDEYREDLLAMIERGRGQGHRPVRQRRARADQGARPDGGARGVDRRGSRQQRRQEAGSLEVRSQEQGEVFLLERLALLQEQVVEVQAEVEVPLLARAPLGEVRIHSRGRGARSHPAQQPRQGPLPERLHQGADDRLLREDRARDRPPPP